MAELAGRTADGVNLPDGPGLGRLLGIAREARANSGRDPADLLATVSSNLRPATLQRLAGQGVDRVVTLVRAPFVDQIRQSGRLRRGARGTNSP